MEELNKKIAEWVFRDNSRSVQRRLSCQVDFTSSLDACFKYIVPELLWFIVNFEHIEVSCDYYVTLTDFYLAQPCREYKGQDKDPALAFCKAVEKLIDGEPPTC